MRCKRKRGLRTELIIRSKDTDEFLAISQHHEHLFVDAVHQRPRGGESNVGHDILCVHCCDLAPGATASGNKEESVCALIPLIFYRGFCGWVASLTVQ